MRIRVMLNSSIMDQNPGSIDRDKYQGLDPEYNLYS